MDEVQAHYQQVREADRLLHGSGVLERVRTEEVMGRYLPTAPARLLDVGGGPGTYLSCLLGRGYEVRAHESDPVMVGMSAHILAVGTKPT